MNRRDWMKFAAGGTAGLILAPTFGNTFGADEKMKISQYPNEHFYKNGEFDQEIAKKAYAELFRYHNYSLTDAVLKSSDFWMLEFGQKDFSNVGMGGIFFVNDKEHGYFGHEIYLLPGQMIAEHYHIAAEGKPAKHETWHVRHGSIWTVAQGGDKSKAIFPIPKSQEKSLTCFDATFYEVGGMESLRKLEEPHFMMAGPEGAIVTEYASYHSGEGLRFTNPTVKL